MTAPQTRETSVRDGDRLTHAFCHTCHPFQRGRVATALCGHVRTLTGGEHGPRCVVCADLFDKPCPRCGS
jgi:hypothetical protein